jgi:Nuclease-related domain
MKFFPTGFKRTRCESDDCEGMISPVRATDAFRQSAIRFLACIAALSVAGLALVLTNPAWWPVSMVTAGSIPLVYHLAGLGKLRAGGSVAAMGVMERLGLAGYSIWHDVSVGDRVVSHVVVGPTGVFSISNVNWSGRFLLTSEGSLRHTRGDVGGLAWEASRNVVAIKTRLRAVGLRRIPVRAVIAATRAGMPRGPIDAGQAAFMRMGDVVSYVLSATPSLAPQQVTRAIAAFEGEEPTERTRPGRG